MESGHNYELSEAHLNTSLKGNVIKNSCFITRKVIDF